MATGYLETILPSIDTANLVASRTFYGLRVDKTSGKLYLDVLDGDTPITLPGTDPLTEVGISSNQYLQWFWSKSLVKLYWGDTATNWENRLLMKVL